MVTINLTAIKDEEIKIKKHLETNASEALAEKINNGVKIVKDGKTLINKKTIATFINHACEESRKQAEKGARFACIDDATVFGWAIHYFEEDSIEGTLYNEDGTEHKPAPEYTPSKAVTPAVVTPPKPKNMTLFDLMETQETETVENDEQEPDEVVKTSSTKYSVPDEDGVVYEKEQELDIYNLDDF